jgi:hypothetical protein
MLILDRVFRFRNKRQKKKFDQSLERTLEALSRVGTRSLARLTRLTAPQIEALRQEIAAIFPANNLPGYLLHGLVQARDEVLTPEQIRNDLLALFRSVGLTGVYGSFIGGPAAVLYGYQKLLELAGRDVDVAFPAGTWQFYANFGLREDTARHTIETIGFQLAVPSGSEEDTQAAAWVAALSSIICAYDQYLEMLWREPTLIGLALQIAGDDPPPAIATMRQAWLRVRPFRLSDNRYRNLAEYRRQTFDDFFADRIDSLSAQQRGRIRRRFERRLEHDLAAFQEQMSVLSSLRPARYRDDRQPIPLRRAKIGLIVKGHYYLLPVTRNGRDPLALPTLQATLRKLLPRAQAQRTATNQLDARLAESPRGKQTEWRDLLSEVTQDNLTTLGQAPFLLHWTPSASNLPLADLRRTHRGLGDQALTVIRTPTSMVFDLASIFFDGTWGAVMSEILTGEAVRHFERLKESRRRGPALKIEALPLRSSIRFGQVVSQAPAEEVAAENDRLDLAQLHRLRAALRGRDVYLTVNDVLLLFRTLFPGFYRPDPRLRKTLAPLAASRHKATKAAASALKDALRTARKASPALLILLDASYVDPRQRIYPLNFYNPFSEMLAEYQALLKAQRDFQRGRSNPEWQTFSRIRNAFLSQLQAFAEMMVTIKTITWRGKGAGRVRPELMALLPRSIQQTLDQTPLHLSSLNELIQGEEIFCNLGLVPSGSSLTRFASARDDGGTKTLVWGIMTDDRERLVITLRDFRPHVAHLAAVGRLQLAQLAARDLLNSYVDSLNAFNRNLLTAVDQQRAPR